MAVGASASGTGRSRVNSPIRRRVTAGASSASPAAITRTASNSRSAVTSLSRKPLAPARSASNTYSSRSNVVRISTRGPGSSGVGQLPGCLDPVQAGHPDVHQHHVRAQLTAHPHRLAAVARGAEHGEVRLRVQQRGEPGPHHLVVVGDDDADGHWCILSGRVPGHGVRGLGGQLGLDEETAAARVACLQGPADRGGPLAHAEQAVAGVIPGRLARPVVADPKPQRVIGVAQLDVDGRAGCVPPGVGEGLLHDPVGGQLHARIQPGRLAGHDEPDHAARCVPRAVHQVAQLRQARLRATVRARPAAARPAGSRSGCGSWSCSASSRSTPSRRRISVSPARAVSPIAANRCAPASGRPGVVSRPVSACTAIIEMWCATTSCSSRAILARSPGPGDRPASPR